VHRDRGADGHYTVTLDNRKCYLTTKQHEDRKCFGFDLGLFLISDYLARAVFDSGSAALIGGMKKLRARCTFVVNLDSPQEPP
jgi:hypothetical protein